MRITATARHVAKQVDNGMTLYIQGIGTISHSERQGEGTLIRFYFRDMPDTMIQLRESDVLQVWNDRARTG